MGRRSWRRERIPPNGCSGGFTPPFSGRRHAALWRGKLAATSRPGRRGPTSRSRRASSALPSWKASGRSGVADVSVSRRIRLRLFLAELREEHVALKKSLGET